MHFDFLLKNKLQKCKFNSISIKCEFTSLPQPSESKWSYLMNKVITTDSRRRVFIFKERVSLVLQSNMPDFLWVMGLVQLPQLRHSCHSNAGLFYP